MGILNLNNQLIYFLATLQVESSSLIDRSEDAQLEAAIQASLEMSKQPSIVSSVDDDDDENDSLLDDDDSLIDDDDDQCIVEEKTYQKKPIITTTKGLDLFLIFDTLFSHIKFLQHILKT